MLDNWIEMCLAWSIEEAEFYSGARKIIRHKTYQFDAVEDDLQLKDCGYTSSKQKMLIRNYLHEESRDAAVKLWERRVEQDKYGSVGFTTYNHFVKGGGLRNPWELAQAKKSGKPYRASVMGPCIQSLTMTYNNKRGTDIDVFYRTTELYKKFPADLVFIRDVLLAPFDFSKAPIATMTFHFANVTLHPMYFVTLIPLLANPIRELDIIKKHDPYFFNWVVKWTARYLCPEHFRGIEKFSQAMRVRKDALERITNKSMKTTIKYLNDNHPGYKKEYVDPDKEIEGDEGE